MTENYKNESMVDVAFSVLTEQKEKIPFDKLYKLVCEKIGLADDVAESKKSRFYTNLCLDGRIVNTGDNIWDLATNQKFDTVHTDLSGVYTTMDTDEKTSEEANDDEDEDIPGSSSDDDDESGESDSSIED